MSEQSLSPRAGSFLKTPGVPTRPGTHRNWTCPKILCSDGLTTNTLFLRRSQFAICQREIPLSDALIIFAKEC
jgi:hypothetical protein